MSESHISVLFLCKSNCTRSIMGEAILNRLGQGKVRAFSAGSEPSGVVHPHTIYVLGESGYDIDELRSKSWDEFGASDAPQMDLVIAVCEDQSLDAGLVWPGRPARALWSVPDPVKESMDHDDARAPFRAARSALETRILALADRLTALKHVGRDALEDAARAA